VRFHQMRWRARVALGQLAREWLGVRCRPSFSTVSKNYAPRCVIAKQSGSSRRNPVRMSASHTPLRRLRAHQQVS
jgi:hypothetical protein